MGLELPFVALLGLGTMLAASSAHAQTPSAVLAAADVTPSVVARRGVTTVNGADWEPDTEVTITLDGAQGEALATTVVSSDGTFTAKAEIPCDTSVGLHAIGIFGTAGPDLQALEISIEVVESSGGTAATGSDVASRVGAMLTLLAFGIVTITITRPPERRRGPAKLT